MYATGLRVTVLGQLAASRDEIPLDLGGSRQRALFALLALFPNTVLHRETIIDAVWGEDPPATAVNLVQGCVSRLRQLLRPDRGRRDRDELLVSDGLGYGLRVTADELDLLAFRDRVSRAGAARSSGDPVGACDLFAAGLDLWRGEPLLGVQRLREHPGVAGLRREWAAAVLGYAEVASDAGADERALPALWTLARNEPLNESAHAWLMIALAATGQQGAALQVFGDVRDRLDDELGVRPGAGLVDAHLRVLKQQVPAGAARAPATPRETVPRQLPAEVAHFVGRAAEFKALAAVLDSAAATTAIAAISGAPGIGKTALAVCWAHRVAERFPDGQLYVNLRGFDPSGEPVAPAEAVRGFLDAFQVPAERIPVGLAAQAGLYRSLLAGKRVLVVLDNARDADQIRPLLPGAAGCLTVVTSRSRLTSLIAAEGARPVTLEALSSEEGTSLLARRIGADRVAGDLVAAEEIIESCARLPLALSISAARAAIRPGVPLAALAAELRDAVTRLDHLDGGDATSSVRAVFSWSWEQLGAPAARMFGLLGLHPGPDISGPAAASLAGLPVREARAALDELMLSSLVTEDCPGRYALHDLLRVYAAEQAIAGESEAGRRAAVHRMLDHYLVSAHGAALLLATLRAPLTLAAAQPGVTPERLASYGDAQTWYETEYPVLMGALAVAEANEFDAHTWRITWCLWDFFAERARADEWHAAGLAALAGAARADDRRGQAYARHGLGNACSGLGRYEDACAHYAAALELYDELADVVGQASVHLDLGLAYEFTERHRDVFGVASDRPSRAPAALGHARQALALFGAAGDRANEAMACSSVGRSLALNGQQAEAAGYCERSLRMHHELGSVHGQAVALVSLAYALHKSGDYAGAVRACERGLGLCRQSGSLRLEAVTLTHLGEAHRAQDNLREARAAWEQALIILDDLNNPDADQVRARVHGARQTR